MIWFLLDNPATTTTPVNPLSFIQYGILGVVLVMLLTGWLWAKPAVEEMMKRHEADRKLWEEKFFPILEHVASGLELNNREMVELNRFLHDRKTI